MNLKIEICYGNFKAKGLNQVFTYEQIKNILIIYNNQKGYVRKVGLQSVSDCSSKEDIFAVITLDYEVLQFNFNSFITII